MSKRKVMGLKQRDRYKLMKWVDANRDACFQTEDSAMADYLREHLNIPHLTKSHVGGARRSFGIMKPHVISSYRRDSVEVSVEDFIQVCQWLYEIMNGVGYTHMSHDIQLMHNKYKLMLNEHQKQEKKNG